MTLTFTQSHRVSGILELVQSFSCKVAWNNSKVCDGWLCKLEDLKEVLGVWQMWIVWAFALLCLDLFAVSAYLLFVAVSVIPYLSLPLSLSSLSLSLSPPSLSLSPFLLFPPFPHPLPLFSPDVHPLSLLSSPLFFFPSPCFPSSPFRPVAAFSLQLSFLCYLVLFFVVLYCDFILKYTLITFPELVSNCIAM